MGGYYCDSSAYFPCLIIPKSPSFVRRGGGEVDSGRRRGMRPRQTVRLLLGLYPTCPPLTKGRDYELRSVRDVIFNHEQASQNAEVLN